MKMRNTKSERIELPEYNRKQDVIYKWLTSLSIRLAENFPVKAPDTEQIKIIGTGENKSSAGL